jgi:hypothetical protein
MERLDRWGTEESYPHYAVGWAHAMDTPYQWTKQVASHFGGMRNGTIVQWPGGITAKGEVRNSLKDPWSARRGAVGGGSPVTDRRELTPGESLGW